MVIMEIRNSNSMNELVYKDDSLICTVDGLIMKYIKIKLKGM